MKFSCRGYDKAGAAVHETIEASDRQEATETLRRRGVFVTDVSEHRGGGEAAKATAHRGRTSGGRLDQVATFMRQLSLLVSTGTPLVDAMCSLERQTPEGEWKQVLGRVRLRVEEGSQLSDAMGAFPQYFDAICRSLIAAGEQGGKIEVMLARLSALLRQQIKVRKTVTGAMIYPALLILVSVVVVTAMLGFVMPRFEGLFQSLNTPLPASTAVLMDASAALREYWWVLLTALAVVGVSVKLWLGTEDGQRGWDTLMLGLPQVGKLTRSFATAQIARMLGTLLEGRVALLDALSLTRQSLRNSHYIELIAKSEEAVIRGEAVSVALANPDLINPQVCEAIKSGERTGQMATVLVSVAQYLDEDNEVLIKTVTGLLEPIILILLGLVVGGVAISMFLPLFDLTAAGGAQ